MQGQFIYIKYAFEELVGQLVWTLPELKAHLPNGLSSMYKHVLNLLNSALEADSRQDLMALLHDCILPVLVVTRDVLTVAELVWATDGPTDKVRDKPCVSMLLCIRLGLRCTCIALSYSAGDDYRNTIYRHS